MDVNFTGEDLILPPSLQVGEKLKDGRIKGEVRDQKSNAIFSTFEFKITDGTVTGKETVVTPLEPFECYKISYNMNLNTSMMGINILVSMNGIEYITKDFGIGKSEYYNKNGKWEDILF